MATRRKNLAKYKKRLTRRTSFLSKPKNTIKKHTRKGKFHKRKSYKHRSSKGGFGKGTKPLIGSSWDINNGANHYAVNQYGEGVGGIDPYFGDTLPAPQHTYGAWASSNQTGGIGLTDLYRSAVNGVSNYAPGLGRVWNGLPQNISPSPLIQRINKR